VQRDVKNCTDLIARALEIFAQEISQRMEGTAHQQPKCDEDAGKPTGLRKEHVHRGLTVKAMRTLLGLIAAGALTSTVG
jgi:hypothetical protein